MTDRPIKLSISALGGQGGGVLADWLIEIAEAEGYLVQSTSVPGVAQRTGATIYYLEFFPRAVAERLGREPVMALMPVSGDVDCVLASELAEAGRAIQRGLVSPERTTLIASSHRAYVISEKSAMGDGAADTVQLLELVRSQSKRLVLFDMEETAERNQSVISSVLLGALCGSGVLPFRKEAFKHAIEQSGIAVKANLAAFEDAYQRAQRGDSGFTGQSGARLPQEIPTQARSPALQPLLDRIRRLPAPVQPVALAGARRAIDYQDPAYASLYLDRLERIVPLEGDPAQARSLALLEAVARGLALWMTFEDTIRVADLKTRGSRVTRVAEEIRAERGQLFGVTEFMKPRVEEIAGTLPAGLGNWVLRSPSASRWLSRWSGGRQIRTRTVGGFVLLHVLGGLRRWRRSTLRYQVENRRIEDWLRLIGELAPRHYSLAVELARAQRLIKGYGETHERGWRNFTALLEQLETLAARSDGAIVLAALQTAALADEEGVTLRRELQMLQGIGSVATQPAG
ncbi:MAG TPA: indolepyruvate oxidoreductase subunit beta family protein [Steroidobacteraceae bacterium]|nr:indolepyruvate oxidoreductase subunit beta family protein [Steroidobacteraceae bacterium]